MKVAVLGSGSWGTALTILLARNSHEVVLAGRSAEEMEMLRSRRENLRYLPGFVIPDGVRFAMLGDELEPADLTVVAVPSGAVREVLSSIRDDHPFLIMAAKGLEAGSGKLMTEVALEARPGAIAGIISGPNLAVEIARGIPTAAVAAYPGLSDAERARDAFMCKSFRVYVSDDVVGVELAGALKNVLAIGAGMADGLGFGDNTKGAFLARGLHEMTVLGLSMGARVETFMGLAGVGDLFATAASSLSRNYRVGKALGEGANLKDALERVDQVAEGVATSVCASMLGRRQGVPMPVFEAIEMVIAGRLLPRDAVGMLMERTPKCEGFLHA